MTTKEKRPDAPQASPKEKRSDTSTATPKEKKRKKQSGTPLRLPPAKYAVIQDDGKQYKVTEGAKLIVDRKNLKPGEPIEFDKILLYTDGKDITIGTPLVKDVRVKATVEGEVSDKKVRTVKFKPKKGYRRKIGHREKYTRIKITQIS